MQLREIYYQHGDPDLYTFAFYDEMDNNYTLLIMPDSQDWARSSFYYADDTYMPGKPNKQLGVRVTLQQLGAVVKENLLSYYRVEMTDSARRFLLWMMPYRSAERKRRRRWRTHWQQS